LHFNLKNTFIYFFFLRILSIFKTHKKKREGLKEIDNGVYSKESNSWIHNKNFKTSLTHIHFLTLD